MLAIASGCYSLSISQEPKPLSPGKVRASAGITVNAKRPLPLIQTVLRVGIAPRTEARLKLSVPGVGFVSNVQAGINIEPFSVGAFSLFLMPHYRYELLVDSTDAYLDVEHYPAGPRIHAFDLPALLVLNANEHLFFVGPDVHVGTRDRHGYVATGGHVGVGFRLGPRLYIAPEFGLVGIVAGPSSSNVGGRKREYITRHELVAEFGLSVSFGAHYADVDRR